MEYVSLWKRVIIISLKLQRYFQNFDNAGLVNSNQFLEIGNQYDVTIYCAVKINWCSVLLPLLG